MKIRTDFVTNSSSYSSAEIVVDNPFLLEILQRYQGMGLFEDENIYFKIDSDFRFETGDSNFDADSIDSLQDCLQGIIELITSHLDDWDRCIYEKDLFKQMVDELHEKEMEIFKGYKKVLWFISESSNEEDHNDEIYHGYVITEDKFTFDEQKGEEYYYRQTGEPFDDSVEPFVEEIHRLNGKGVE